MTTGIKYINKLKSEKGFDFQNIVKDKENDYFKEKVDVINILDTIPSDENEESNIKRFPLININNKIDTNNKKIRNNNNLDTIINNRNLHNNPRSSILSEGNKSESFFNLNPTNDITQGSFNKLDETQSGSRKSSENFKNSKLFIDLVKSKTLGNILLEKHLVINLDMVNIKEKDEEGRTILHRACLQLKKDIIQSISNKIIENKMLDEVDNYGNTALILACKTYRFDDDNIKRKQILKILAENGADLDLCETINGWAALHWLSYIGDDNSFELLFNKGAVFFVPDKLGYFPLDLAGMRGHKKIVLFIIIQYIEFLEKIGEFEILDPKKLNIKTKKLNKNDNIYNNDQNNNFNFNVLNLLNSKKDLEHESYISSQNDDSIISEEEDNLIITNLELVNPFLQTILVKIILHHCLYWGCYFKINNMIINKLITLYKAEPNFQIYSMHNQTSIHAACADGNLLGLKLLLNKINDENQDFKINKINLNQGYTNQGGVKSLNLFKMGMTNTNNDNNFNKNNKSGNGNGNLILHNLVIGGYKKYLDQELKLIQKEIKSDPKFKILEKSYKKYLLNMIKYIMFNEKQNKNIKVDIMDMLDSNLNNPLHLASKNGKIKFIKELFQSNLIEINLDKILNKVNKESYSGYALLKDQEFKNKILSEAGKKLHTIPQVVMELTKIENTKNSINLIMKIAIAEKLQVSLIQHRDKYKVYLCIDIPDSEFKIQAEKNCLKIKLLDKSLKKNFENKEDFINLVEPFYSRMRQEIISKVISNIIDLKLLKDQKILSGIFYTHKPNAVIKLTKIWLNFKWFFPSPLNLFLKLLINNKKLTYEEIDLLYRYFGEKTAIYYTFVSFYINYLVFIAMLGLGMALYYREKIFVSYNLFPTYGLIYLLWSIIMIEMWKRKLSEITHKWGVNDISNTRVMRAEFKGDEYFKDLNGKFEKHYEQSKTIFLFLLSLPVIIGLLAAVVIIFQYATEFQQQYQNNPYLKYVPGFAKSIAITIITNIYDRVAIYFTNLENHKYEDTYENAMIAKLFTFRLVADLTAVIYTTIIEQNVENLKTLLYSLIAVKMISEILTNVVIPYLKIKYLKKSYFQDVEDESEEFLDNLNFNTNLKKSGQSGASVKTFNYDNIDETILERKNDHRNSVNFNSKNERESEILKLKNNSDNVYNIDNYNYNNTYSGDNKNKTDKFNFENTKNTKIKMNNNIRISNKNLFKNQINKNSTIEGTINPYLYRKIKIIPGTLHSHHNTINPDHIELNNMLPDKKDIVYYYADICIIFTITSLFAIIIPMAPVIILIGTLISHNLKLYGDLHLFKRPLAKRASNIGLWLNILEFTTTASIMFNSFLYYFYTDNLFNTYQNIINKNSLILESSEYNVGKGENALLIIALAEHILILLKYFLKYIVSDTPSWVVKERDILMSILEESNKKKEEEHNKAVENVVNQYFEKFKVIMTNKDKKIERRDKEIKNKEEKIELFIKELEKVNVKINEFEFINRVLTDNLSKFKINKDIVNTNSSNKLNAATIIKQFNNTNAAIGTTGSNENLENSITQLKQLNYSSNKVVNNSSNKVVNNINSPNFTSPKFSSIQNYEEMVDFKFDNILKKMVNKILTGRKIILEDESNNMKQIINKIYIFNLMKNTFDRIEKEIMTKKFAKCLNNLDKPILLCNLCSNLKAIFYCNDCEEKLCQSCNELHMSNNLWGKHKLEQFFIPDFNNNFKNSEHIFDDENKVDLKQKIFRKKTFKHTQTLNKKKLKELFNDNNQNKSKKNILNKLKETNNIEGLFSLFIKMENFCFPQQIHNLNYENLKFYFNLLFKEYIDNNGINQDNLVDTKKFLENKININLKLNENPISVLNEDFVNKIWNVSFNLEEQFFINRIAFMKFKQLGANLTFHKIFEVLKVLQSSTIEEKLRVLLNLLDIYDNKLIMKSEFEKLLVFISFQNYKNQNRFNYVLDEIFGKKLFIKYEDIYSDFLNKSFHREVLAEILQVD